MQEEAKPLKDVPCSVCNEYKAKRLCTICSKALCLLHCKILVEGLDIYRIMQSPHTRTKFYTYDVCDACTPAKEEKELPKTQ